MSGITSKYKVTSFPKIMAIGVDKKKKFYEGEIRYKPIFDFCNIYQETISVVGKDTSQNEQQMKPWMKEKFPEYTKESANEICFNVDQAICVILINKEKPNSDLENVFLEIQKLIEELNINLVGLILIVKMLLLKEWDLKKEVAHF